MTQVVTWLQRMCKALALPFLQLQRLDAVHMYDPEVAMGPPEQGRGQSRVVRPH